MINHLRRFWQDIPNISVTYRIIRPPNHPSKVHDLKEFKIELDTFLYPLGRLIDRI